MSDSSNPSEGRPAAARSYGDLPTAVRPAQTQVPQHVPPIPPAEIPVPQGTETAGRPAPTGIGGGRPFPGAGRSFAKVGAAITGAAAAQAARIGTPQTKVRKARLRVARLDPWSVMKISFVLSIAMGIVTVVGAAVVWSVLNALGVFSSLSKTVGDLTSSGTGSTATSFNLASILSFGHVEGYMIIIALVDVVLVTALATLGAYLYNLAAGFVGGFEVTLADDQ